jgi:hypothetical protein
MKKIQLFAALTKVDELKREVWGLATAEIVDKDGEIFDYASSKPYFQEWSQEIASASSGRSLGNVREMHQSSAVGKLVDLEFDDEQKTIAVGAKIVDDDAWQKCVEGVYTGFSIGGRYVNLWPDGEFMRFTAQPVEISVVDNPAVPNAHFTAIKRDGSWEVRKFVASGQEPVLPVASSQWPAAPQGKSRKGDIMKPEQEEKMEKAIMQSASSLEKIAQIDSKLQSLEAGLKELADAFRKFTEGFAKSFTAPEKRVARTSVTVSKEDDYGDSREQTSESGRQAGSSSEKRFRGEGDRADADPGFLEAMKQAHARTTFGA